MDTFLSDVRGFNKVVEHFGEWPIFHDAIVEGFTLDLQGISRISLRTWNTSTELDERGYFKTTDHATVSFALTQILSFELSGADLYAGGILFGLRLDLQGGESRFELDPSLGIGGWIRCKEVMIELSVQ